MNTPSALTRVFATLGLAFALLATTFITPADAVSSGTGAAPASYVHIHTAAAIARGGYMENGKWVVFRPYYPVDVTVLCPAGHGAALQYSPVFAMNLGVRTFTCTGARQSLKFYAAAAGPGNLGLSRQRPTVLLHVYEGPLVNGIPQSPGTQVASDSANIWVLTLPLPVKFDY